MVGVICAVAAAVVGVVLGLLMSRPKPTAPVVPDPVVLKEFAARREAIKREAIDAKLDKADLVDALRGLSR